MPLSRWKRKVTRHKRTCYKPTPAANDDCPLKCMAIRAHCNESMTWGFMESQPRFEIHFTSHYAFSEESSSQHSMSEYQIMSNRHKNAHKYYTFPNDDLGFSVDQKGLKKERWQAAIRYGFVVLIQPSNFWILIGGSPVWIRRRQPRIPLVLAALSRL